MKNTLFYTAIITAVFLSNTSLADVLVKSINCLVACSDCMNQQLFSQRQVIASCKPARSKTS